MAKSQLWSKVLLTAALVVSSLSNSSSVVASTGPITTSGAVQTSETFDPYEKSIDEINLALSKELTTSVKLVEYYLERIEAYDQTGPKINSIISINKQALTLAKELDEERKVSGPRSKLHGIPVLIKDNYDVVGMPTTAGSVTMKDAYPSKNAFVVQKLIDAGAIVIAKTNMSEFAASYGRLGYSSIGGLTLNPYNLKRDVSGSSSGSAAAVAANFAVFALGTDTGGSIRGPANVAGLVGIRPTTGLTSRSGVVPASLTFDTTGPMTRSVSDAAIALSILAGTDKNDYATRASDRLASKDYSAALNANALINAKIGIAIDFFGDNTEVDSITNEAIASMEKLGATFVPVTFSERTKYLWDPVLGPVGDAEFKVQLEKYLARLPIEAPKTLRQIIEGSEAAINNLTPVNPKRINGMKVAMEAASIKGSDAYNKIIHKDIPETQAEIKKIMLENGLDAIVFPTMSCPASNGFNIDDPSYDCDAYDTYAAGYVSSATGFPEITVPAGVAEAGVPVGISFFGLAYSEQTLLNLAYSFEQATQARFAPLTTPQLIVK